MCSLKWWGKKHSILLVRRVHIRFTEVKPLMHGNFPFHTVGVSAHSRVRTFTKCTKEERGTQNHSQNGMNSFTGRPSAWRCHKAICSADNEKIHTIHVTGYMCVRKSKGEALLEVNHCVFLASDGGRRQLRKVSLRLGGRGRGVWEGAKGWGVNLCGEVRRTDRAMNICSSCSRLCVGTMSHSEDTLCQSLDNHQELPQFSLVV